MNWRGLEWFQDNLKIADQEMFDSLKKSIIENGIERSFKAWETKGKIWILDGHLMYNVLKNLGQLVPDRLSVELINCKDEKDAAGKVLRYSSIYHKIAEQGLYNFQQKYELDLPSLNLKLPDIDLDFIQEKNNINIDDFFIDDNSPEKEKELICPHCGMNIYSDVI